MLSDVLRSSQPLRFFGGVEIGGGSLKKKKDRLADNAKGTVALLTLALF